MGDIRPAQTRDAAALGRMGAALARQHHDFDGPRFMLPGQLEEGYRAWLTREMSNGDAVVLVAVEGEEVLGYAYGRLEERDWNLLLDAHGALHDVWVDAKARGAGWGERLVEAMVAALVKAGAPRVLLSTAAKNESAQRLFKRLGFRPTMIEMTREAPSR